MTAKSDENLVVWATENDFFTSSVRSILYFCRHATLCELDLGRMHYRNKLFQNEDQTTPTQSNKDNTTYNEPNNLFKSFQKETVKKKLFTQLKSWADDCHNGKIEKPCIHSIHSKLKENVKAKIYIKAIGYKKEEYWAVTFDHQLS